MPEMPEQPWLPTMAADVTLWRSSGKPAGAGGGGGGEEARVVTGQRIPSCLIDSSLHLSPHPIPLLGAWWAELDSS